MTDPLLTSAMLADYLHSTVRSLDSMAYRRVGPSYSRGPKGRRLYRQSDVDRWLGGRRVECATRDEAR
jgi:hypothetical protein